MTTIETRPRPARPKRADKVIEALRARIADGEFRLGDKLPTEVELVRAFGVSRTVVREAVAVLAADGLLQPRQGAGVFVIDRPRDGFAALLADLPARLSAVLNVLEVRMAVEIESAGLAAQRRSAAQEAEIRDAFERFNRNLAAGEATGNADFAFHRSIAEATNNPFYVEILDVLGRRTIPRDVVAAVAPSFVQTRAYLETMQVEHADILTAITAGDPAAARLAMRRHLLESQRRYQTLLQESVGTRAAPETGSAEADTLPA